MSAAGDEKNEEPVASGALSPNDESEVEEVKRAAPGHGIKKPEFLEFGSTSQHDAYPSGGMGYAYHYGQQYGQAPQQGYGNVMTMHQTGWNGQEEYVRSFANEVVNTTRGVEIVMKPETFLKLSADQQNMLINVGSSKYGHNPPPGPPALPAPVKVRAPTPPPKLVEAPAPKPVEAKKTSSSCMACNSSHVAILLGGTIALCSPCLSIQHSIKCTQ